MGRLTTLTIDELLRIPGVHLWPYRREDVKYDTIKEALGHVHYLLTRKDLQHVTVQCEHHALVSLSYPYFSEPCLLIYVSHATLDKDSDK